MKSPKFFLTSILCLSATGLTAKEKAPLKNKIKGKIQKITHKKKGAQLNKILKKVLSENPGILVKRFNDIAAARDVEAEQAKYLPKISINSYYGYERMSTPQTNGQANRKTKFMDSRQLEFKATQSLFKGLKDYNTIALKKGIKENKAHDLNVVKEETTFMALESILNIKKFRDVLKTLEEQVNFHKKTLEKIKTRREGGAGKASELELIESRLASVQERVLATKSQLNNELYTYEQIVQEKAPSSFQKVTFPKLAYKTDKHAYVDARKFSPMLMSLQSKIDQKKYSMKAKKSEYYPTIDAEFKASETVDTGGIQGRKNEKSFLIKSTWNVFSGGNTYRSVEKLSAEKRAAVHELNNAKNRLKTTISTLWNTLKYNQRRLERLAKYRDESQKVANSYSDEFLNEGTRTLFDVMNAKNEFYSAKVAWLNIHYEIGVLKFRFQKELGKLATSFNIL